LVCVGLIFTRIICGVNVFRLRSLRHFNVTTGLSNSASPAIKGGVDLGIG
jgi:hypothetical protein